jgi:hypothetical protein
MASWLWMVPLWSRKSPEKGKKREKRINSGKLAATKNFLCSFHCSTKVLNVCSIQVCKNQCFSNP